MAPVDTLQFGEAVRGLPEQLADAHRAAAAGLTPAALPSGSDIDHIVVCGMGGSGIAGDVLSAFASNELPVPVVVLKRYRIPRFVGPRSLVFAISYSGTTEETLDMAAGAADAGARIVAVCTGGPLADIATDAGGVVAPCPPGYMPRAALGALIAPLVVALHRMGMLPSGHEHLVAAERQLAARRDRCAPEIDGAANPAREIARQIDRTIPLVYGGGAIGAVAAMRWKNDINENAKAPAFWNAYPELDHNEICGWGQHGDVTRQLLTLVELRHDHEHSQLGRRFEATRRIIDEALGRVLEVRAEGEGRLAQALDLMYFGSWTSLYLAYAAGVDPGPIDAIAQLKGELAAPNSH